MSVKLLDEYNLEFLSLTVDCPGSSESTLVKMPQCWKSHAKADTFLASARDFGIIASASSKFEGA